MAENDDLKTAIDSETKTKREKRIREELNKARKEKRRELEKWRFKDASVRELKLEKIWLCVPVLAFPHTLVFAYGYQLILCLYFGNWQFLGIIALFMSILSVGVVFDNKKMEWFCLGSTIVASGVFLYLTIIMIFNDYSSTRVSFRPAPHLATCFFLFFLNLLTIWPFLVLAKIIHPTRNRQTMQDSEYERKVKVLVGRELRPLH